METDIFIASDIKLYVADISRLKYKLVLTQAMEKKYFSLNLKSYKTTAKFNINKISS